MRQRPYSESRVGDFSRISYLFSRRPGRESRPGNRKCRRFKRTRVTCFSRDQGLQGASSPVISSIVSTFLLSLFLSLTFPTLVVFILVRTPPFLFVAQFHLPVSRQLSRENCEKGWGRERGNSLRGILVPTRHYLARETSQLRWWCSHTVGTFGGGRERERENISCTPPRLALIISGQTKKSIFSECERMEMSNFTRGIYFICRISAITVMIRATLKREFYVLRNNLIYEWDDYRWNWKIILNILLPDEFTWVLNRK